MGEMNNNCPLVNEGSSGNDNPTDELGAVDLDANAKITGIALGLVLDMELRSENNRQNRNDFGDLKSTLANIGCYEDGMETQEMQQVLDALLQSEDKILEDDLERAIRESELDFMQVTDGVANSTMIIPSATTPLTVETDWELPDTAPPLDTPEGPIEIITTFADVHHPMDWSPTQWPCSPPRSRLANRANAPSPVSAAAPMPKVKFVVQSKGEDIHRWQRRRQLQRSDSGMSLSRGSNASETGSSSISSLLTASSCTPSSSSVHSELSQSSLDDNDAINCCHLAGMPLSRRLQVSTSSAAISSDGNEFSMSPEQSSIIFID